MFKIDFEKVVTQAVTSVVVATFMGAAYIVWQGATSVDTKVKQTREDLEYLITTLSGKLAGYEVQLTTISNQLNTVLSNQARTVTLTLPQPPSLSRLPSPPPIVVPLPTNPPPQIPPSTSGINPPSPAQRAMEQTVKSTSEDIFKQLKR